MGAEYGQVQGSPRGGTSEPPRPRLTGRLVFGAVLVTLGVLWTLDNLGVADADRVLRWWPALLVGYGFVRFTGLDGCRRMVSGTLLMVAGGWMLARELGLVQVSIFTLWPAFMIVIGASLVWRSMRGPGNLGEAADRQTYPRPFAFMGGVTRNVQSQDLVGMEATAVMGGVEADFRDARARGPEVIVEAFAWWGGIDLIVPDTWRVVSEVMPVMGGVEDQTRLAEGGGATTLVVRGLVVMGGLEIKNHRGESRFQGVRAGAGSGVRGSGPRKEANVDASGVSGPREAAPPPQG